MNLLKKLITIPFPPCVVGCVIGSLERRDQNSFKWHLPHFPNFQKRRLLAYSALKFSIFWKHQYPPSLLSVCFLETIAKGYSCLSFFSPWQLSVPRLREKPEAMHPPCHVSFKTNPACFSWCLLLSMMDIRIGLKFQGDVKCFSLIQNLLGSSQPKNTLGDLEQVFGAGMP